MTTAFPAIQPPVQLDASLPPKLFLTAGDFWTTVFGQPAQARLMASVPARTSAINEFRAKSSSMAGLPDQAKLVEWTNVAFSISDVSQSGIQTYDDPNVNYTYGPGGLPSEGFYNVRRINYFSVPLGVIIPYAIQGPSGVLTLGRDFFIQAGRWIYFRQDPRALFPDGRYCVISGEWTNPRSLWAFLLKTNDPRNNDILIEYLRVNQTPYWFFLAACAAAGLGITRRDGVLISITTGFQSTVYVFTCESVRVTYAHTPLVVGAFYQRHTVIGGLMQFFQSPKNGSSWWRQANWDGGISLAPILPDFPFLNLVDQPTVAYTSGQDPGSVNGSKVHAQVTLSNNFYTEQPYWQMVGKNETAQNQYLNQFLVLKEQVDGGNPLIFDTFQKLVASYAISNAQRAALGLPPENPDVGALPQFQVTNALDLFFTALLGRGAFVITIDMVNTPCQQNLLAFMRRESPAGFIPIVLGYGPKSVVPVTLNDNLSIDVSVVIDSTPILQVQADVDYSQYVDAFVIIRVEGPVAVPGRQIQV